MWCDPIINSNYKFMVQCMPSHRLMLALFLSSAHHVTCIGSDKSITRMWNLSYSLLNSSFFCTLESVHPSPVDSYSTHSVPSGKMPHARKKSAKLPANGKIIIQHIDEAMIKKIWKKRKIGIHFLCVIIFPVLGRIPFLSSLFCAFFRLFSARYVFLYIYCL